LISITEKIIEEEEKKMVNKNEQKERIAFQQQQ
jgi:hypothetical protein